MQVKLHNECMVSISQISDGNMAYHVPLNTDDVHQNRKNFARKIGLDLSDIVFMNQTHSSAVSVVDSVGVYDSDAIITKNSNIALAVMVADCIPIVLYDSAQKALGVIHAGRVGTFHNILQNCCKMMQQSFKTKPEDLILYMGPSIRRCCYEVSKEMAKFVATRYSADFVDGNFIDLQAINHQSALLMGIKDKNIIDANICTCCKSNTFYSYRAQRDRSGRFILVAKIESCN